MIFEYWARVDAMLVYLALKNAENINNGFRNNEFRAFHADIAPLVVGINSIAVTLILKECIGHFTKC